MKCFVVKWLIVKNRFSRDCLTSFWLWSYYWRNCLWRGWLWRVCLCEGNGVETNFQLKKNSWCWHDFSLCLINWEICEKCGYYFSNKFIVSIHKQVGHVKEKRNAENMTIILQAKSTINWSMNKFLYDSTFVIAACWFNVGRSHGSCRCWYQTFDMIWKFTCNYN